MQIIVYLIEQIYLFNARKNNSQSRIGGIFMKKKLNYKLIGQRIEHLRRINGVTQEMLAEKVDLSRVYIAYIETGKRKPGLESIVKISQALNSSIDNILIGNITPNNNDYILELALLSADCSNQEKRIIFDTLKSLKASLINNRELK